MTDEKRPDPTDVRWQEAADALAVPVEGDRERLAALMEGRLGDALDGYGDPHAWALLLADDILRAGVSLTGSGLREAVIYGYQRGEADERYGRGHREELAADNFAALSGESGEPTYEAVLAAMVAHDEGTGESGEPKVCPRCGRWDSHDHAVPVGESDASLRDAPTPCPKGCREKETGNLHPAHVGRCGLPTGHLGVVSCYCTVSA